MPPKKTPPPSVSRNTNISVGGDVNGNIVLGDNNTVNQTVIQKFFNIFKSDAETVDQRNRRIMLGHVENFWVKGILEKSLHGAALLDLGIKEDPDALTYPWAIKREANKETLPAGTSMLEIFQEIGMGRSLLILGAPGSGKTTMLLELTRQLIERAREDVTEPIPVVFNLSSWTEKLTLADWLARELNVIYTIPKKVAPTWVKENKMLLLLDGLDEVKQESRDKCVDAINQFRKENGLTSMAVCSRIQDYAELKTRLSFDGAIEIQPLTSNQVDEYFKRFGEGLAGIRQVLEKDVTLREMTETPLFLSIMTLAYKDTQSKDILISENIDIQHKRLFDTYIERMFERPDRSKSKKFTKRDVLHWLSWLAQNMIEHNKVPYLLEYMQPKWLSQKKRRVFGLIFGLVFGLIGGLIFGLVLGPIGGLIFGLMFGLFGGLLGWLNIGFSKIKTANRGKGVIFGLALVLTGGLIFGLIGGLMFGLLRGPLTGLRVGLIFGLIGGLFSGLIGGLSGGDREIKMIDRLTWDWKKGLFGGLGVGLIFMLVFVLFVVWLNFVTWRELLDEPFELLFMLIVGLIFGLVGWLLGWLVGGFSTKSFSQTIYAGNGIAFSIRNFFFVFLLAGLFGGSVFGLVFWLIFGSSILSGLLSGMFLGLIIGLLFGLKFGGLAIIGHYALRIVIAFNNLLPWKLISFLNYCVDLIFLRRVGGGYIFVHRLLMEHFAAIYPEE